MVDKEAVRQEYLAAWSACCGLSLHDSLLWSDSCARAEALHRLAVAAGNYCAACFDGKVRILADLHFLQARHETVVSAVLQSAMSP